MNSISILVNALQHRVSRKGFNWFSQKKSYEIWKLGQDQPIVEHSDIYECVYIHLRRNGNSDYIDIDNTFEVVCGLKFAAFLDNSLSATPIHLPLLAMPPH